MSKFQLCMFRREKPVYTDMTKVPNKLEGWERGIAKVGDFSTGDIEFIIDESGRKIKKPWSYRLLLSHANSTIDTEAEGAFPV